MSIDQISQENLARTYRALGSSQDSLQRSSEMMKSTVVVGGKNYTSAKNQKGLYIELLKRRFKKK